MSIVSLDVLLHAEPTPTNTTTFGQSIWWQQGRQSSYSDVNMATLWYQITLQRLSLYASKQS